MQKESLPSRGTPENKHSLDALRGRIVRAALLGGLLSVVQACRPEGLKEEDIQQLPKTSLVEIRKDPKRFIGGPMIRTEGYPILDRFVRKSFEIGPHKYFNKWRFYTLNEESKVGSQPVLIYYEDMAETEIASAVNQKFLDEREKETQHKNLRRHRIIGPMVETSQGPAIQVIDSLNLDQSAEKAPEKK